MRLISKATAGVALGAAALSAQSPTVDLWMRANEASYIPTYSSSQVGILIRNQNPAYPYNTTTQLDAPPANFAPTAMASLSYGGPTYVANSWYGADVFLLPGRNEPGSTRPNSDYFDNPLIVCDAFDPFDKRTLATIYAEARYNRLVKRTEAGDVSSPRYKGYDVFFINFTKGGGDIQRNAHLLLKFMEWLQTRTRAKIIVGGPSMSGIVARLALLYSMPQNNDSRTDLATGVKGYISIDSPHQGAVIAASLQKAAQDVAASEYIGAIAGFGSLLGEEANKYENWWQVNVPAAAQMLKEDNIDGQTNTSIHTSFYGMLRNMGNYRKGIPSVAIAYSNFHRPHDGIARTTSHVSGRVLVEEPIPDFERHFRAGGDSATRKEYFELAPGSVGDGYFQPWQGRTPKYLKPYTWTFNGVTERYKGTFIPIQSALDLNGNFNVLNPPSLDEHTIATYTPFHMVYFMKDPYNGYCNTSNECRKTDLYPSGTYRQTADDKRYHHIIFDAQLMTTINKALDKVEAVSASIQIASDVVPALLD